MDRNLRSQTAAATTIACTQFHRQLSFFGLTGRRHVNHRSDRIFWTTKAGAGDRRPAGLCSPGEALRRPLVRCSSLAHSSAPPEKQTRS
jgi:hypothetical protein